MSEMIERVARNIRAVVLETGKDRDRDWEAIGYVAQQMYRREARAAIEAMREPTADILSVGVDRDTADGYWRLMIDKALK